MFVCKLKVQAVPAEVQQRACGGGDSLSGPAKEVELREGARLLSLHVLQVEAANQEVVAPDVLRHQVHLETQVSIKRRVRNQGRSGSPRRCGRGRSLRRASSGHTASLHPPPERSSSRSRCIRSPKPSASGHHSFRSERVF